MKALMISIRVFLIFTILTGVIYPLAVTFFGKILFEYKANGSLITVGQNRVGSELIAQGFIQDKYFWPRPSAVKYDASSSGASNLSVTSADGQKSIQERELKGATHELKYSSGSGLDPHISLDAAKDQFGRIARARGVDPADLSVMVESKLENRQFGFLGQKRVNVLLLNIGLDEKFAGK